MASSRECPPNRPASLLTAGALAAAGAVGCGGAAHGPAPTVYRGGDAPISGSADAAMVTVPGGRFIAGSTPEERETAYLAHAEGAGNDAARDGHWFDREEDRH